MELDKKSLNQIEKIVEKSAEKTKVELRKDIQVSAEKSKNEIIAVLSREITDLAEINHAVISEASKIGDLEKRIIRLEIKAGI